MTAKTPWHLWLVAILAILWNLMGAFDYVMTQTKNATYMQNFTQAQLDYFYQLPSWFVFFWALAIWSSVLGSVLLLMRKRLCTPIFLISVISVVITCVYSYGFSNALEAMGGGMGHVIFSAIIFLIALFLYLYSRSMASKGLLN